MKQDGSVLLDTNIIVEYIRGDETLRFRFAASQSIYVPRASRREQALTKVRDFLRIATLLLPDAKTAEVYGEVKAGLSQIGKPIPENDVWIAAVARQHDLPVVTRDGHFDHVQGLTVLAW